MVCDGVKRATPDYLGAGVVVNVRFSVVAYRIVLASLLLPIFSQPVLEGLEVSDWKWTEPLRPNQYRMGKNGETDEGVMIKLKYVVIERQRWIKMRKLSWRLANK